MIFCYTCRLDGAQYNYHQRGFIQQLIGADKETNCQTLGRD